MPLRRQDLDAVAKLAKDVFTAGLRAKLNEKPGSKKKAPGSAPRADAAGAGGEDMPPTKSKSIDEDEDDAPAPKPRKVASAKAKISKIEFRGELFNAAKRRAAVTDSERNGVNVNSKVWQDLTPFDRDGAELRAADVKKAGLAFRTRHEVFNEAGDSVAFVEGKGVDEDGEPNEYEAEDSDAVGNSQQAFHTTQGYVHQFKFRRAGYYTIKGWVDGKLARPAHTIRIGAAKPRPKKAQH